MALLLLALPLDAAALHAATGAPMAGGNGARAVALGDKDARLVRALCVGV